MSLLTPEPGLLFWMLLSFGIVVFVLGKYGFPVILAMVNKRREYIENSLLAAQKAEEELANVKKTSDAILSETRKQQSDILAEAGKMRDQMIEKAKEEARQEADKLVEITRKHLQAEKESVLKDVRAEIASLSVDVAEKLLKEKLSTSDEQMGMINRLLDEMTISKS